MYIYPFSLMDFFLCQIIKKAPLRPPRRTSEGHPPTSQFFYVLGCMGIDPPKLALASEGGWSG